MAEAAATALAPHHGRLRAQEIVQQACQRATDQQRHLRDILADDPDVTSAIDQPAIERLFEPTTYLGSADQLIDRALAHFLRSAPAAGASTDA